jgi:spore maturation protein CgeB
MHANADDLTDEIKFYIEHNALRESIAAEEDTRTHQDHIYSQRFQIVFERTELK